MPKLPGFALAGALTATLLLAACDSSNAPPGPDPTSAPAARSGPDAKPGIAVSEARLVLPAVRGNPGAAYFTVSNTSDAAAVLKGIMIGGTENSDMHRTTGGGMSEVNDLSIAPGAAISFKPGGDHAMVFGIKEEVEPGSTGEMTLIFADGDKVSVPIVVEAPGGADHGDHN